MSSKVPRRKAGGSGDRLGAIAGHLPLDDAVAAAEHDVPAVAYDPG